MLISIIRKNIDFDTHFGVDYMKIAVFSDTHGNLFNFETAIEQQKNADLFIFLGDREKDLDEVKDFYPTKQWLSVHGNCDFGSITPSENETVADGKRIFYTHGHNYHVKYGYDEAITEAHNRKADILLFGHTHVPYVSYEDGLYILNPGSLGHPREGRPTYGIIDILPSGILINTVEV